MISLRAKSILSMFITGLMPNKYFKKYRNFRFSKNSKLIIYIDLDGTIYNYKKQKEKFQNKNPHVKFPQSIKGFFETMETYDGAIDSVRAIIESGYYEVYFLTAPSTENTLSYTEKRIAIGRDFGLECARNMIISDDKSLSIGDVLIDDLKEGRGQDNFIGKLILHKEWKETLKTLI